MKTVETYLRRALAVNKDDLPGRQEKAEFTFKITFNIERQHFSADYNVVLLNKNTNIKKEQKRNKFKYKVKSL